MTSDRPITDSRRIAEFLVRLVLASAAGWAFAYLAWESPEPRGGSTAADGSETHRVTIERQRSVTEDASLPRFFGETAAHEHMDAAPIAAVGSSRLVADSPQPEDTGALTAAGAVATVPGQGPATTVARQSRGPP